MTLTAANSYTGATTVGGATVGTTFIPGTLTLNGANGALTSATTIDLGGTVLLDNNTGGFNNNARLNVATTLNGGTLSLLGNPTVATTESIGAITLGAGASTIALTQGAGGNLALAGTTLTRSNGSGGVVNFTGTGLGTTSKITFSTTAPALTGTAQPGGTGLLPYATVNGSDFATYTATGGIVPYTGTGAPTAQRLSAAALPARQRQPGGQRHGKPQLGQHSTINALMILRRNQQHLDHQPRRDADHQQRRRVPQQRRHAHRPGRRHAGPGRGHHQHRQRHRP